MNHIRLDTISPQELEILNWFKSNDLTNNISDFIRRPDAYNRFLSGVMGWHWEDEFLSQCKIRGFTCTKAGLNSRFDIMVNNNKVQCKFSASSDSIDIRNKDKNSNRRYKLGDFHYMAISNIKNVFIVPINALMTQDLTETISSVKINDILIYKDNYEALNGTANI